MPTNPLKPVEVAAALDVPPCVTYEGSMKLRAKEMRQAQGLSTTALAELAGVSRGYISLIENGQRQINARLLDALAKALKCSPVDLIDDESTSPDLLEHLRILRELSPADRSAVIRHASGLFYDGKNQGR